MDIAAITGAAAMLLATRGGEMLAGAAGRAVWNGFARLAGLVRSRLGEDPSALEMLDRAQEDPADGERTAALAGVLAQYCGNYPDFRDALAGAVEDANNDPAGRLVIQVQGHAQVAKITTFSGEIHGNITF